MLIRRIVRGSQFCEYGSVNSWKGQTRVTLRIAVVISVLSVPPVKVIEGLPLEFQRYFGIISSDLD